MLFICDNLLKHSFGSAFTNSSFTRDGFLKSKGYTSYDKSCNDDIYLRDSFAKHCITKIESILDNTDFIYQWQGVSHHNSHIQSPMMNDEMRYIITGDRDKDNVIINELEIDYEVYDNIVNLAELAMIDIENGVKIKLSEDGSSIKRD